MGDMSNYVCRRQVLAGMGTLGAAIGVVGLAGCGPSGPQPKSGEQLIALADVPVGGSVTVTSSGGQEIVVSQPEAGAVHAVSAICTHQGCEVAPVEDDPEILLCPCHHSEFETFTGDVLQGPATEPLPEIAVVLTDGQVLTA